MTARVALQKRKITHRSKSYYQKASRLITGGVHSNYRFHEPHPRYYTHASGPYIWDVDGNKYVDCILNAGACVLGHGYPKVVEAVKEQLKTGLTVGLESELSIETAQMIHEMVPSAEVVRFSNSGTEAVMHAIQIARGHTGRDKIAKLEGGFNGWYDYALVSTHPDLNDAGPANNPVSVPASNGLSQHASETIIVPFNDIENTSRILQQHKDEIAALILEPVMFNVGCVQPRLEYLKAAREVTEKLGAVLIFDEIISGFRMAPGGAQEYYGVTPDMSTFAKAMANGFPLSAVVGKREIMEITNPKSSASLSTHEGVAYYGTYNGNQMSLAAARATLGELKSGKIQKHLHERIRWLRKEFVSMTDKTGIKARMAGIGGKFCVYFMEEEPVDYRTAMGTDARKYALFRKTMVESGIMMHPMATNHHGITWSHTNEALDEMLTAMEFALREVKRASA
jgi:glutamate-1-semialdehyde 2,1-aminomutase